MTALIENTSSAPTLRERAARALAEAVDKEALALAEKAAADLRDNEQELLAQLSAKLGVLSVDYILAQDGHNIASVDGLRFSVRLPIWEDRLYIRRLHVETTCARGCREALWVEVSDMLSLGNALAGEHTHLHDCLVVYDENGDPVTDRDGKPLGPFSDRPRSMSAREKADAAIARIEAAAERLAAAHRAIQELEDGRPAEKSAAIRRLMQTENTETGKPHSASSAEKIVETDAEYAAYRRRQADAEVEKHRAIGAFEVAKTSARIEAEAYACWARNV